MLGGGERSDGEDRRKSSGSGGLERDEGEPDRGDTGIGEKEEEEHGIVGHGVLRAQIVESEEKS